MPPPWSVGEEETKWHSFTASRPKTPLFIADIQAPPEEYGWDS